MDILTLSLSTSFIGKLAAGFALYSTCLIIHRLVFSPIAGFPGPKIVAVTRWYEFYFDFFRNGTYIFEIEKMHKKYGMTSVQYYGLPPK